MSKQDENNYLLILNQEIFFIPKDIKDINEVSEKIYQELLQNGKYTITSNVQNSVFKSFLDYWQNEKVPVIDSSTFDQYRLLINEFGILSEILTQTEIESSDDMHYYAKKKQNKNQQI